MANSRESFGTFGKQRILIIFSLLFYFTYFTLLFYFLVFPSSILIFEESSNSCRIGSWQKLMSGMSFNNVTVK